MLVYHCDICKKVIKEKEVIISARVDIMPSFSFCAKCGEPVKKFLEKNKLYGIKTTLEK